MLMLPLKRKKLDELMSCMVVHVAALRMFDCGGLNYSL